MPLRDGAAPLGVPEFDLADRLRKALRESDIGVQTMADYLEVDRGTVSTWINGRIKPSGQTIRLFALRTGVNYAWLKDGQRSEPGGLGPVYTLNRDRRRRHRKPEIIPDDYSTAA